MRFQLVLVSFCMLLISCVAPAKKEAPGEPATAQVSAAEVGPKYAATTHTLSREHGYFRGNAAPDFWALMPFYVPQKEGFCQAASYSMIVNAVSNRRELKADEKLVLQPALVEKANQPDWKKAIDEGKCPGLDVMEKVLGHILKVYGFDKASVKATHVTGTGPSELAAIRKVLSQNERSDSDFILANFTQGTYTGDPEAAETGHVSMVGAYDAKNRRVLILDVDRDWYEPYWVSDATFLKGLATQDKVSKNFRGYLMVKVPR
jgi:hypothetical protein